MIPQRDRGPAVGWRRVASGPRGGDNGRGGAAPRVVAPAPRFERMIHLIVTAGLGNRMRSIASAIALGRETGMPVRIDWHLNRGCNAPFRTLFRDIPAVRVDDLDRIRLRPRALLRRAVTAARIRAGYYDLVLGDPEIVEAARSGSVAGLVRSRRRVLLNTVHRFHGSAPFFRDFIPADAVRDRADAESANLDREYVGVHVRRTDHAEAIRHSPLGAFVAEMRRRLEERDTLFFLATDDDGVEAELRREFPGRIRTAARTRGRDTPDGIRDALVDLLILSRARLILGSYWSSFSRTAAEWGGIPVVTIRSGDTP